MLADPPEIPEETSSQDAAQTVLVVDDLPMILDLVDAFLADSDFRVHLAAGGSQALDICHRLAGRVDLLLTDVRMPDMHGPELYRQVHQRYPEIKVLFMSGFDAFELTRLGMPESTDLLAKPFGPGELLRRMESLLSRSACSTVAAAF